jgi:hypothetical protein
MRARNTRPTFRIAVSVLGVASVAAFLATGPNTRASGPTLEQGFREPPHSAQPRVWWHWMNGNVTKKGIQEDLEWMHRVGIGGFQNFDAGLRTPQIVEKRLIFMTPEWKDAFRFTTELADSLGLEMAIAGSPGWSESGGPWVPPADGMKKYVWSETRVEGGQPFEGTLPRPPSTTGTFQNAPPERRGPPVEGGASLPEYYQDAAVVAFRVPAAEAAAEPPPKVKSSGGQFDLASLTDGDVASGTFLPAAPVVGEKAWIQYEFAQPRLVRGLSIVASTDRDRGFFRGGGESGQALEASDDGQAFRTVAAIPGSAAAQRTITFPPTRARFFRVTFETQPPRPNPFFGNRGPEEPPGAQVAELVLHAGARVNHFEEKAAFASAVNLESEPTPAVPASDVIRKADVIDLNAKMRKDGTLDWSAPAGDWIVMRLGYSLTGRQNHPASPEATGLEVDKLDPVAVRAYFDNYLDQYEDATGGLMGKHGLQYVVTDSWEAGVANWTGRMMDEFEKRRGYSMLPWLPVLTGRIVESAEASDEFLWDLRATLAELVAQYHYDQLTTLLHARDMGRYTESHEGPGRAFIGDGMEVKRTADVPMSAMWTPGGFGRDEAAGVAPHYKADVRESASVAHIYGQNLVAAESLTAIGNTWAYSPERLKPTADMELASGLNRFVIHTSVHQPVDDKVPGLGLGPFGQWFTRHETWAEQARPWVTYLARSSFMLQQGQFVADVLYVYGEDHNVTALCRSKLPPVPEGYNFDFLNAGAIASGVLSVSDGRITTRSGMSYRLLALDPSTEYMTLPVLRRIRDLVNGGAILVGARPVGTPSLSDDAAEFESIAAELWGQGTGERAVGAGVVHAGRSIAEALAAMGVAPDFQYTKPHTDTQLLYVHRELADGDVYWVNNRNDRVESLKATFRVDGRAAELWRPVTGEMESASYRIADGRTTVPLKLEPNDAVFVVFREKTEVSARTLPEPREEQIDTVGGPWEVRFQPDRGAPPQVTFEGLRPWNESPDPGVKYFSGTATYAKTLQVPDEWFEEGTELWVDLGEVKNLAEVVVNGQSLGIVWTEPFQVNVSEALRPGENALEIRVTNLWVNRLIGDQQPDAARKYTYTTQAFYQADSPLLPSGLLGPVRVVSLSRAKP